MTLYLFQGRPRIILLVMVLWIEFYTTLTFQESLSFQDSVFDLLGDSGKLNSSQKTLFKVFHFFINNKDRMHEDLGTLSQFERFSRKVVPLFQADDARLPKILTITNKILDMYLETIDDLERIYYYAYLFNTKTTHICNRNPEYVVYASLLKLWICPTVSRGDMQILLYAHPEELDVLDKHFLQFIERILHRENPFQLGRLLGPEADVPDTMTVKPSLKKEVQDTLYPVLLSKTPDKKSWEGKFLNWALIVLKPEDPSSPLSDKQT